MGSFKKIAIGFGLVSIITLQGLQAKKLKACQKEADKVSGCVEIKYFTNGEIKSELPYKNGKKNGVYKSCYDGGTLNVNTHTKMINWKVSIKLSQQW